MYHIRYMLILYTYVNGVEKYRVHRLKHCHSYGDIW